LALAAAAPARAAGPGLVQAVLAATSGFPPPAVGALAEKAILEGVVKKLKVGVMTLVALGNLAFGIGAIAFTADRPESAEPEPARKTPAPTVAGIDAFGDPLPAGALARLGTLRFRCGMWPKLVAGSPDGSKIVTVGHNLTQAHYLTIWDTGTGRPLRQ